MTRILEVLSQALADHPDLALDLANDMSYFYEDNFVLHLAGALGVQAVPEEEIRAWQTLDLEGLVQRYGVKDLSDYLFQALLASAATPTQTLDFWVAENASLLEDGWWAINRILENPNASLTLLTKCLHALVGQGQITDSWLMRFADHPSADDSFVEMLTEIAEREGWVLGE
jgi:hypothetical protein